MRKSDFTFKYRIRNWPDYNRALVRRIGDRLAGPCEALVNALQQE